MSMKNHKPENEYVFGTRTVIEAIQSDREIERVFIQKGIQNELQNELIGQLSQLHIPYTRVPLEKLNRITKKNHQGVIAFLSSLSYTSLDHVLESCYSQGKDPLFVILDRITDVRNMGAIARTLEAAGASAMVIESKGNAMLSADAMKTSAGALNYLPVCRVQKLTNTISYLKDHGIQIVAATEKADKSIYTSDFSGPIAVIVGSEENGISEEIVAMANVRASIPMKGKIGSLNVSVSTGILLYEILRQRIVKDSAPL